MGVNFLAGSGPHYAEIGAGITVGPGEYGHRHYEERRPLFLVLSLGYRYQPRAKGLTVRAFGAAFYLLYVWYTAGVSVGIRF